MVEADIDNLAQAAKTVGGRIGQIKLGRREFLQYGAAAGVATALGALGIRPAIQLIGNGMDALGNFFQDRILQSSFESAGLGDYYPFYQTMQAMEVLYGVTPIYDEGGWSSTARDDPYTLLKTFVQKGMSNDIKRQLITNWGEQAAEVYTKAEQVAKTIQIEIDPGLPDTEEQVRREFLTLARVFPYHTIVAPPKLRIVRVAGYHDISRYSPIEMAIQSPAFDREGFYRTGYHELFHGDSRLLSLEAFWRKKTYIHKKQFTDYLTVHAQGMTEVFYTYFSLPWDKALAYREKLPLPLDDIPSLETIKEHEAYLLTYGVDVEEYSLPKERINDPYFRDSRILYAIMQRRVEILTKDPKTIKRREKQFLVAEDEVVKTRLRRAAATLQHYFVGPVQKGGGGLPGKLYPVSHRSDHLTQVNMRIQLARLRSFSSLNDKELNDFDTASQALRDHFGIEPPSKK